MNNIAIFKEAKRRFYDSGKMLESMLAFAILIFSFVFALIASNIVYQLLFWFGFNETQLAAVLYLVLAGVLAVFSMPVFFGYVSFMHSIFKGEREVYVVDVFCAFTSPKRYFKAFIFGIRILLRVLETFVIPLFVSLFVYFLATGGSEEGVDPLVELVFTLFSIGIFFVIYFISSLLRSKGYLGVYLFTKDISQPIKKSKKALRSKLMRTFWLKIFFLFIITVSVLSIGTLFLVTAPIMAFAYFIYAQQFTENIK